MSKGWQPDAWLSSGPLSPSLKGSMWWWHANWLLTTALKDRRPRSKQTANTAPQQGRGVTTAIYALPGANSLGGAYVSSPRPLLCSTLLMNCKLSSPKSFVAATMASNWARVTFQLHTQHGTAQEARQCQEAAPGRSCRSSFVPDWEGCGAANTPDANCTAHPCMKVLSM